MLAEINKINEQILDCYQNFDNHLLVLHQRKVKTQQAVYQVNLVFFYNMHAYALFKPFKQLNFEKKLGRVEDDSNAQLSNCRHRAGDI